MSLVLTQEGGMVLWQQIFGLFKIGVPFVRLLGKPYAPTHLDNMTTLGRQELSDPGYAPFQLNPIASTVIAAVAAGGQAVPPMPSWTFTGAPTVYGYWLTDASATFSLWAEALANPFPYPTGGYFALQLPVTLTSTP